MVTVLVPLDRSGFGEAALPIVKKLVRTPDDHVVLTQICHPPDKSYFEDKTPFEEELQTLREIAEQYLREIRLRLEAEGFDFLQIDVEVRTGEPVSEIVGIAAEKHADLILMATHGRTGIERVLLGSVAGAVLRSSNVPVVLVRPPTLGGAAHDDQAADQKPATREPV
jgi:nucleotide-binding universal stress UspA family protein